MVQCKSLTLVTIPPKIPYPPFGTSARNEIRKYMYTCGSRRASRTCDQSHATIPPPESWFEMILAAACFFSSGVSQRTSLGVPMNQNRTNDHATVMPPKKRLMARQAAKPPLFWTPEPMPNVMTPVKTARQWMVAVLLSEKSSLAKKPF